MSIQEKMTNILELKKEIFKKIIQYCDAKSIGKLALVSRKMRLAIGGIVKDTIKEQQAYCKKIVDCTVQTKAYIQYKELLQDCHIFQQEQPFIEFIEQMNEKNKFYYINLFSIVLGSEIKINNKNIYEVRRRLKSMCNDVFLSFFQLQFASTVPKLQTQMIYLPSKNDLSAPIITFVNKLLQYIKTMQMMSDPLTSFIGYSNGIKYIQQFSKLKDVLITNQYQTTIYYLKFGKSYHQIINFNLNSVIISFLNIKDLQKLRRVDSIFNKLVKQISRINNSKLVSSIAEIQSQISQQDEEKNIYEKIKLNNQIKMSYYEYQYIYQIQIQPKEIDLLYKIFNQIYGFTQENIEFNYYKNSPDIYKVIFENPYELIIDEQKYEILEKFIKGQDYEIFRFNTLSKRIYNNLEIIYQLKYHNLQNTDIQSYVKNISRLQQKQEYLVKSIKYQSYLNTTKV